MASIEKLKQLREETGISMMECKKALEEANDDIEKAKEILREKGKEMIKDKGSRKTAQGLISSYIHPGGKTGVLLELHCETDFVAKGKDFSDLAHELCLQIAAAKPLYVKEEDVPEEEIEKEKEIYKKQFEDSGKPAEVVEKIMDGKLSKYKAEISLLSQEWIKDPKKKVSDLVSEYISKTGENIEVYRFARFEI